MKLQAVRGTQDLFFSEYDKFAEIIHLAAEQAKIYSFSGAATPIFEFSEVFKRTLGEFSEVVNKEMYSFDDRSGNSLTLRPEFTASIARAVITNGLYNELPLKLFSHGPVFRYERPQRARQRQFHQLNFEYIGSDEVLADLEILALADSLLKNLGISDKCVLEINNLADITTRKKYIDALVEYFTKYKNELSADSQFRLEKNPLRILDSKDQKDKELISEAPLINEFYPKEIEANFNLLLEHLSSNNIAYKVNPYIVRGLDYYNYTTFEFITQELGAQGTVLAGGRYDGLLKLMGGRDLPGIGFAAGIERLAELMHFEAAPTAQVNLIILEEALRLSSYSLVNQLRKHNIAVNIETTANPNKALKKTLNKNIKYALFVGQDEIATKQFTLKNLSTRQEQKLTIEQIIKEIQ